MIAPVASTGPVTLAPGSTSHISLAGRLIPQSSPAGLATVSDIFNTFIQGEDSNVTVQGSSAGPSDVCQITFSHNGYVTYHRALGDMAQSGHPSSTSGDSPS